MSQLILVEQAGAPSTPGASKASLYVDTTPRVKLKDDAGTVTTLADTSSVETLTNKSLILPAGSNVLSPLQYTSGTNLTAAAAGATEFDGTNFYQTIDATSGRAFSPTSQIFRLAADGGAIGAGIADYFGANSAFPYVANGIYLFRFYCYFLKTTAGTITWTLTSTQTLTNLDAWWLGCVITGFAATGATSGAGISKVTTAASALPVTGTLSTGVDHYYEVSAIMEGATAGNMRLRVTNGAGTVTPRRGSFYTATRLFAGNVGTFVA